MTHEEIQTEANYRFQERLGILCGNAEPTTEQATIALQEYKEYIQAATAPTRVATSPTAPTRQ